MMEDFNRDNAAIDAALKSNADKAAALQTALAGAGNCSIETKSYTGNGNYGQSNPTRIALSKKPRAVWGNTLAGSTPAVLQIRFISAQI